MNLGWKVLIPIALGWFLLLSADPASATTRTGTAGSSAPIGSSCSPAAAGLLVRRAARSRTSAPQTEKERCSDGLPRRLPRHAPPAPAIRRQASPRSTPAAVRRRSARAREARQSAHDAKIPKPERLHGRHVLNRYEDGMEKCIGCELCAGVCPAKCIYVRGADNDPDDPTSPGERFGFVYEINYLRCIHCDLCVEACPTEAITETQAVRVLLHQPPRRDLHQGRAARRRRRQAAAPPVGGLARRRRRQHRPAGCGRRRRRGDADFEGVVGWSGELGYGVRAPEAGQRLSRP